MKERLISIYDGARGEGGQQVWPFIDYCNTPISARAVDRYVVRVTRYDRPVEEEQHFDVRNVSTNVFLDRVARWLVADKEPPSDGSSDPLDW